MPDQQFGDLGYGFFGQQGQNMPNPTGSVGIDSSQQQPQNWLMRLLNPQKPTMSPYGGGGVNDQGPTQQMAQPQLRGPLSNYYSNMFNNPNAPFNQNAQQPGYTPNPYGF